MIRLNSDHALALSRLNDESCHYGKMVFLFDDDNGFVDYGRLPIFFIASQSLFSVLTFRQLCTFRHEMFSNTC